MNHEERTHNKEEHILVCLSPSPSNQKVIRAAAKLADAFGASLTAIYVKPSDYDALSDIDRQRLQNNCRFAEQSGATVTMIVGDDIPLQIAEFAHISGTTKIVVGRSSAKRGHFWNKAPLTERLIVRMPNVDIYIIPDLAGDLKYHRDRFGILGRIRPTKKDLLFALLSLVLTTLVGLSFHVFGFSESNIITVYILGILITSITSTSPLTSVVNSLLSVILFNYFFIEPRFSLHTYEAEYAVTFAIMLIASLITGTLAGKLKDNARHAAQEAFRAKVLFDTNQLLKKAEDPDAVLTITAEQVIALLDRDVIVYKADEDQKMDEGTIFFSSKSDGNTVFRRRAEKENAGRVFKNALSTPDTGEIPAETKTIYHAICSGGYCYGVLGIHSENKPLEAFEYGVLMSIIGECALALDSLRNASEKEQAAIMAQNEQLRANLLRTISHDIRTPLTSISGNASNLLTHYEQLDHTMREQIFTDIYDDSIWLINLVENLLSISRIENGRMNLNATLDVVDDVIAEALNHVDRRSIDHKISVRSNDEVLLARMDARLITQVLINLINNAIKNTPKGSEIVIDTKKEGSFVVVTVSDNGDGVSDALKDHLFEMFATGQNKIIDGRRGLGLGLALSRSIVEAHGGTIQYTDNDPKGACFSFTLPAEEVTIHE